MKATSLFVLLFTITFSFAQKTETITIPKGIVYNYCSPKIIEKAKKQISDNLSNSPDYALLGETLIIGPELWKRFKDKEKIQKIEKGRVEFHVDKDIMEGKMCQDLEDTKSVWEALKNEVGQEYTIRKANEQELQYYWSVISFDIDEPLLIIETKEHNYILNLLKKDLKLMWLDEAPKPTNTKENSNTKAFKIYQDGKEIDSVSKGVRETKLEKMILLNTDEELKESSSVEDLSLIINKASKIFEELFKNSDKSGKIMVQFELKKKENNIQFSVKDNIDLQIMKEFEKRINNETFPNSKKKPISFQLIFKVNDFNDTE